MSDDAQSHADPDGDDQICYDVLGWCHPTNGRNGLIVWGEPWDPHGWEASEGFLRKWGWTVAGEPEIAAATNHWRSVRGEEAIDVECIITQSISASLV